MKSYLVDKKILPDMKETRRNVSWHAGEDNYGETGSTIFDSKGISPEMTLCSCLLLTFSHAKKCPSLWKSPNTSCLDGVRTSCSHTLLQISGDVPLWCPTKIQVPLWYCKTQEISLALTAERFQLKFTRLSKEGRRWRKGLFKVTGLGRGSASKQDPNLSTFWAYAHGATSWRLPAWGAILL